MRQQAAVVARIRYPELAGFEERYARNEPTVIVGVPEQHPLEIFRFTPDYLAEKLGDTEFPVLSTDTGFLSYERDTVKMPFRQFVQRTFHRDRQGASDQNGLNYYFKNSFKLLPSGLDDTDRIDRLAHYFAHSVMKNVWISRGSITVGLHFDAAENFNIQIRGRKRFVLYPPGTSGYYPCPMFSQTAHMSRVFREGPELDAARYPKFDPGKALEVILEQGEILYLPAYWWHQVTSLGDVNVNVNTWSIPAANKQLWNWNQALRGHYQLLSRYFAYGNITQAPAASQRRS